MSLRDVGVVIIPEHPFVGIDVCRGSGNFSLNGVVDYIVVQTPTQFTCKYFRIIQWHNIIRVSPFLSRYNKTIGALGYG
jgi:hypothetical protein